MPREFVQFALLARRVLPSVPLVLDCFENSGLLRFMHRTGRVTRHDLGWVNGSPTGASSSTARSAEPACSTSTRQVLDGARGGAAAGDERGVEV